MNNQATAIEVGDFVNILATDYGWDKLSGLAEVLSIDGDEFLVSMVNSNWEGWFNLQRIKR